MQVKAKHSLKYDGTWYATGTVFEIAMTDADKMTDMVDLVEEPLHTEDENTAAEEEAQQAEETKPASGGRGRKKADA